MKARVKATGEIVDVDFDKDALANDYPPYRTNEIPSRFFLAQQLEWIDIEKKADPDYWEKLLHQYAGMAMQGMLSNTSLVSILFDATKDHDEMLKEVVICSHEYATALVNKLKESKR